MPTALVTGAAGFCGASLVCRLLAEGWHVVGLDLKPAPAGVAQQRGLVWERGSTTDLAFVAAVVQRHAPVDAVFHLAAAGMVGAAQLDSASTWTVNVEGTQNVISACIAHGVPRLVYTSTVNVVFGGTPIYHGDEALPYVPGRAHIDQYSRTKSVAEQLVLAANGSPLAGQGAASRAEGASAVLRTCALRPNGIFGAGETLHSMRLLTMLREGRLPVLVGSAQAVTDWTHIDNLTSAQLLATAALTAAHGHVAAGKVYFITDGVPFNSQTFMAPLLEGLGYNLPSARLPYWLAYVLAALSELLWAWLPARLDVAPLLTRSELRKACVSHFFSCARAQRELGYVPVLRTAEVYLPWYLERGFHRRDVEAAAAAAAAAAATAATTATTNS